MTPSSVWMRQAPAVNLPFRKLITLTSSIVHTLVWRSKRCFRNAMSKRVYVHFNVHSNTYKSQSTNGIWGRHVPPSDFTWKSSSCVESLLIAALYGKLTGSLFPFIRERDVKLWANVCIKTCLELLAVTVRSVAMAINVSLNLFGVSGISID